MRCVTILALAAALLAADGAAAATRHVGDHSTSVHLRSLTISARHPSRAAHHRSRRLHLTATRIRPLAPGAPTEVANRTVSDAGHSGWFQSEKEKQAGWGSSQGGAQTVVGFYQCPAEPDIPGPQIYHNPEGRGAAGLSLSLKLGQ